MLIAADSASSTASPVLGYAVIIGMTALMWFGVWRYARPALHSQDGRADRMSGDQRLRRIAWALLYTIYPLLFTVGCVFMAFNPTSTTGTWIADVMFWAVFAAPAGAAVLAVAALIYRTIGRHRGRARHRALGLPNPPAPWWPTIVVAIWTTAVTGGYVASAYLVWQFVTAGFERQAALIQSQLQTATNDPGIQQLIASGASKDTVEDRLAILTGTSDDLATLKTLIWAFMIGNIIVALVIIAVIVIGGVLLYRRQQRRRADYAVRITESVTRAAQLTL